jgi:hypothetical protein
MSRAGIQFIVKPMGYLPQNYFQREVYQKREKKRNGKLFGKGLRIESLWRLEFVVNWFCTVQFRGKLVDQDSLVWNCKLEKSLL